MLSLWYLSPTPRRTPKFLKKPKCTGPSAMPWTTSSTVTAMRPPWCAAVRCRLRFRPQGKVPLWPKDCARNWRNASARNTPSGSRGLANFGVAYSRIRRSIVKPAAERCTNKPARLHLTLFAAHSNGRGSFKTQAEIPKAGVCPFRAECPVERVTVIPVTLPPPRSLPLSGRTEKARSVRDEVIREWFGTAVRPCLTLLI